MIKGELYHKTVQILFDAYFNDTLTHGSCSACAVGNLVAANCGYTHKDKYSWNEAHPSWTCAFMTAHGQQRYSPGTYIMYIDVKKEIDATGYFIKELARIEYAFEMADKGHVDEDWMFNGLCAVLNVLREIHQVTDEDLTTDNNKRFKDHYDKKVNALVF